MNKYTTYFGQVITDAELNEIFSSLSSAIEQFILDFGYNGVAVGGDLAANDIPNLSVNVVGPSAIYDQLGNRISIPTTVNVPVATDENNASVAVVNAGNAKWLSVFVKFKSTDSDARVNEVGQTVYFKHIAGYDFHLVQGAETVSSANPTRPALRGDQILLGDIKLIYGQTTIQTANIDLTRQQTIFRIVGNPVSLIGKNLQQALGALLAAVNSIVGTLQTTPFPALTGTPDSTTSGSLLSLLQQLLAFINGLETKYTAVQGQVDAIPGSGTFSQFARKDQANIFSLLQTVQNELVANKLTAVTDVAFGTSGSHGQVVGPGWGRFGDGIDSQNGGLTVKTNISSSDGGLTVKGNITSTEGDADIDGAVNADSVHADGNIAGTNVTATAQLGGQTLLIQQTSHLIGDVTVDHNIKLPFSGGAANFATSGGFFPSRFLTAPLVIQPGDASKWSRYDLGWLCTSADSCRIALPKLPADGVLKFVTVCVYVPATGAELAIVKFSPDFNSTHPAMPTEQYVPLNVSSPKVLTETGGGSSTFCDMIALVCDSGGYAYNNESDEISVLFNATFGCRITGVQACFYDPGYRSH